MQGKVLQRCDQQSSACTT